MTDSLVPLPPTRPERTSFTAVSNAYRTDELNELLAEAEKRGYRRALANLREEADKDLEACRQAVVDFRRLSRISASAEACADFAQAAADRFTDLVMRVAHRA